MAGQQCLIINEPNHPANNIAAQAKNFELAISNQYGRGTIVLRSEMHELIINADIHHYSSHPTFHK
jgi:hypothetical protein